MELRSLQFFTSSSIAFELDLMDWFLALQAITSYESGLASIEKAVEIYMESDSNPLWDVYFEQIVKMKNSRYAYM